MQKIIQNKYILAFIGALLLYISWPPMSFPFLIFIALVPVLLIEDSFYQQPRKYGSAKLLGNLYILFLIWNILTTWWVFNAAKEAVFAITLNSLFMCIPVLLFHKTRKKFSLTIAYISLVCYWLAFEHLHLRWDISWPWLTLGNVFAKWPSVIQWYEYTGVMGGTVWIWVVNILVAKLTIKELLFKFCVPNAFDVYFLNCNLPSTTLFIFGLIINPARISWSTTLYANPFCIFTLVRLEAFAAISIMLLP